MAANKLSIGNRLEGTSTGTNPNPNPPSSVSFVKQPKTNEVLVGYQQGVGTFLKGEAPFVFNVVGSGILEYRLRNEIDVVTGFSWQSCTSGVDFTVMIPADKAWYRLEIRQSGSTLYYSNVFGCGG